MLSEISPNAGRADGHGIDPDQAHSDWQEDLLDAVAARIAVLNSQGEIVVVNRAWKRFNSEQGGSAPGNGVGVNYADNLRAHADHGVDSAAEACAGVNAVLSGTTSNFQMEYLCQGSDEARWFQMQVSALPAKGGCMVSHINISAAKQKAAELQQALQELKLARQQLVQSEKMASIGLLTAGVAHEINGPVGYLRSNLGSMEKYIVDVLRMLDAYEAALPSIDDPDMEASIEQVKQEIDLAFLQEDMPRLLSESREGMQRVSQIVRDLKDFAHTGEGEQWQWVDLRQCLTRTLNIVHNELKYKAEVTQSYEELPDIFCLPGKLNQIFMNLLVNASHAIDASGQVRVSAGRQDDQVWVEIADTGCGMPPEVVERIFEPFFTTKPMGKGTGLGLSIAQGIVKKHGGHITVDSEVGRGTTFRIVLPIAGLAEVEA